MIASLLAKRFLILTGLAGSGKTKLAQAISRWVTPNPGWVDESDHSKGKKDNCHAVLLPVGADWTSNDNIIGYPDGLDPARYITRPALELIRHAAHPSNSKVPHFLILDEMNLSHVERYFSDILSAIESDEPFPLYSGNMRKIDDDDLPASVRLPANLFVIGTVNVDETTYMFSPKVLDRANVIEFRMDQNEVADFLANPKAPQLEHLDGLGGEFGPLFVSESFNRTCGIPAAVSGQFQSEMLLYFNLLRDHNLEFGYRTIYEAGRFCYFYRALGGHTDADSSWFNDAMDAVIVQKFLPKIHGSRSKVEGLLWALAWACGGERSAQVANELKAASKADDEATYGPGAQWVKLSQRNAENPAMAARYPVSFDKIIRMWRKLVRDQFVSFAEA